MRPPLGLHVELVDAVGVHRRLDSHLAVSDRPQNLSFRTKRGDGFGDASFSLPRRIDLDYADLGLYDGVNLIGYDGSAAYEGRLGAQPRSLGQQHEITIQAGGWMTHAKDRKFRAVYVDRDLSQWTEPSRARKVALLVANIAMMGFSAAQDEAEGLAALVTSIQDAWASPYTPLAEGLYDAGPGNLIGDMYVDWTLTNTGGTWGLFFGIQSDDKATATELTANQAGANGATYMGFANRYRYGLFRHQNTTTPGGVAGSRVSASLRKVAVYGDQGLTKQGSAPGGFFASDVIRDIASRWCPKLNTSGVFDTSHVIEHIVFRDRTTPYDAFSRLNDPHLWNLAVWENRTLHFRPFDLTDYKWQIRTTDPGVSIDLQGDSTEELANFAVVQFDNVQTGARDEIGPDEYPELRDESVENPANRHGIDDELTVPLSYPTTRDSAAQIGRAALAENNQPKAAGTISVRGHIRDRAGNWQPVWKVRAGDTIAVVDFPNDRPRLVVETDYNHSTHELRIAVDSTFRTLEAVSDRILTALEARGLR
jgi:hypothetical protein